MSSCWLTVSAPMLPLVHSCSNLINRQPWNAHPESHRAPLPKQSTTTASSGTSNYPSAPTISQTHTPRPKSSHSTLLLSSTRSSTTPRPTARQTTCAPTTMVRAAFGGTSSTLARQSTRQFRTTLLLRSTFWAFRPTRLAEEQVPSAQSPRLHCCFPQDILGRRRQGFFAQSISYPLFYIANATSHIAQDIFCTLQNSWHYERSISSPQPHQLTSGELPSHYVDNSCLQPAQPAVPVRSLRYTCTC
jgi:hypothetical protein